MTAPLRVVLLAVAVALALVAVITAAAHAPNLGHVLAWGFASLGTFEAAHL